MYMVLTVISCGDVLNVSLLCYLLATSRTGFSITNSSIQKLTGLIIETGCLTSVCLMTAIITCAVMPKNYVFLSLECLMAKLYVNSFIALPNSRYYLQANRDSTISSKSNVRHSVYLSERYLPSSQDERLEGEHFDHADNEVTVHPARPIQAGSCVSVDETEATASTCDDSRKISYLELV
ncbi:uncharacterized protein F5891DRAFT_741133 [Suillus fuscotomentosus]|uniref:DUF6534 domain-containing protein n=1 Tax=Suillus fuscotomentosus TaxID=1912939 RepID=A0AAD4DU47_9AGAM|nr:uncharacterized protein F5891DRAFT_741133 [Suillus fuscotomentosus]KAG1893896.1 hypothetical protein F5891DRAFT_741133 [Suillus fuscotomentosus]